MIGYNFHDTGDFDISEEQIASWITQSAKRYQKTIRMLDITFCSDEFLLEMNRNHLSHDFYTDILTFDLSDKEEELQGEMYISVDRVKENAQEIGVSWVDELHRVIIHGVLHLCGFDDTDEVKEAEMRQEEDVLLALRMF
jgi:probable rRNA maturation factor